MKLLVKKHPLAIRWFHWINFPVMMVMVWSGFLIYWANHDGVITMFGHPVFPEWLFAPKVPGWIPNWHDAKTGQSFFEAVLDDNGMPMLDKAGHPIHLLYNLQFRLAEGMGWHFTFMWLFTINGVLYVLFLLFSGQWRVLAPTFKSFPRAFLVVLHDLHLGKAPPQGKYNDAQKISYTVVIFMGALMLLTGFAIYKPTQAFWLTNLFGGYVMAKWFHFWITILFCAFFLVHVGQVAKTGWNNFRSMITGWEVKKVSISEPDSSTEAA